MTTSINQVTINLASGGNFRGTFFNATLNVTNNGNIQFSNVSYIFTGVQSQSRTSSQIDNPPTLTLGTTYLFQISFPSASLTDPNFNGGGSVTFTFSNGTIGTINNFSNDGSRVTISGSVVIMACLHAYSIVMTNYGNKFIKDITIADKVLTANGQYAQVKSVIQCWITTPGPSHDAVVFEQYSLTQVLPFQRFIIDPGHPIKLNSQDDFRPAGEFVNGDKIHIKKWKDESIQNPTPSIRWDLVLEDGFDNYIANGLIVKSRKDSENIGYVHSYKEWI